jgi:hypothetical protein
MEKRPMIWTMASPVTDPSPASVWLRAPDRSWEAAVDDIDPEGCAGLGCLLFMIALIILAILIVIVGGLFGAFPSRSSTPTNDVNTVAAGSEVPIVLDLRGDHGPNILAAGYPKSEPMDCHNWSASPTGPASTATTSTVQYNPATGRYGLHWRTDKSWAGTCRRLVVVFGLDVQGYAGGEVDMDFAFS